MKKHFLTALFSLFIVAGTLGFGQQNNSANDTESRVPELENFHEVIYQIWHTAYPSKDYQALRNLSSEVNKAAENIYSAKLPGILRDKKLKWQQGVETFKASVEEYDSLSKTTDDEALLLAAENLHTNFEMLVKIIRPPLKEVDAFHQTLYVVYHTYLPAKNIEGIRKSAAVMQKQADAIVKAKLPKRLEAKKEEFEKTSKKLLDAVVELNSQQSTDENIYAELVEKVHSNYQKLDELF